MTYKNILKIKEETLGKKFNTLGVSLLTGSRTFGQERKDSDWDTHILTRNQEEYNTLKNELVNNGYITRDQNPSVNIGPDKKVTVIIEPASKYDKDISLDKKFILLHSKYISGDKNLFKQKKIELEKTIDFKQLKKRVYLKQMIELRTLQGLFKRDVSKPVAKSIVGEVTKRHMQLCILANNTIPPYNKWLYYKYKQQDNFKEAEQLRKQLWNIQSKKEMKDFRKKYFTFTNNIMPDKPYVGTQYWKYIRSDI